MMKKLLLSTQMFFVSICGFAYDCEVDGIYYDLNTTDYTASVTYKSYDDKGYSDVVRIPEEIKYNGTTYSVTSIGNNAFAYCSGLTELTIGNSVTSIGSQAFYRCSGLTKLTIGNSVTSIGKNAFIWCSSLLELTIPNSVTSIGETAFDSCRGLESIIVEKGNLYYDSREGCNAIIRTADNELIFGCKNTFIPTSVTSIGSRAFLNCSGLTALTIPNSVTSIGDAAFIICNNLASVISLIQEPFAIRTSVFPQLTCDNGTLYIPYGTMEKYKATDGWKEFLWMKENASTDIEDVKAEDKSDNIYYDLKGNILDAPKRGLNIINGKKYVIK